MGYQCVYRTKHQFEETVVIVSFIRDQSDQDMDVTENFSQRPHAERRAFMAQLHESYQTTRCVHQIDSQLQKTPYYAYLNQQGYRLRMLMLSAEQNSYHYHCYMH